MINASEARTGAVAAAEENKIKWEQEADDVIAEKIEPAIREAMADGQMSLAISLPNCSYRVANIVFDKLSTEGFDVAVAAENNGGEMGVNWFTLYWSKDRGGNPGNITRPKLAVIV